MIEQFQIFTTAGETLFRHQERRVAESVVNTFISERFVSQREDLVGINNGNDSDDDDDEENGYFKTANISGSTIKYITTVNPDLCFILVNSAVITVHNSEVLLLKLKTLFIEMFEDEILSNLKTKSVGLIDFGSEDFEKFSQFFQIQLDRFKKSLAANSANSPKPEDISTPTPRSVKKLQTSANKSKKSRKWGADGSIIEDYNGDGDENVLDFSAAATPNNNDDEQDNKKLQQLVGNQAAFGNKTKSGDFLVRDLGDEMEEILANSSTKSKKSSTEINTATSAPLSFLRNYIGGKKITKEDVNQITQALINHLIKKNIAPEVARNLVANVEKKLVGSTTKSFTSLDATAKEALTNALTTLLTPNTSIDLLNEIQTKRKANVPYVISVVGVNGVGKSTNLSKLAFWLLQNDFRVLITACDTFRSGAVEQLRVHVNNLKQLTSDSEKQRVDLFEGGYGGADLVSKIAKGAIKYAEENDFDIVLMDTAGRRHNDSKLMAPLASFAKAANPDKIIMVGEALVGTDSVMQAQNFNKAFGVGRKLDCFIISKCDTVGDLIGSMVNMVYATGIPILFVGTGQTYTDLKTLSVDWAVKMLMS